MSTTAAQRATAEAYEVLGYGYDGVRDNGLLVMVRRQAPHSRIGIFRDGTSWPLRSGSETPIRPAAG